MPKPAEILAAAGRSPEALADRALLDALAWVREWGPEGRRAAAGDGPGWEYVTQADGTRAVRILARSVAAPALPARTEAALVVVAGSRRRGLERLLQAADDDLGEKYARFRREFVAAWKAAA
jgi:hypothetical protein